MSSSLRVFIKSLSSKEAAKDYRAYNLRTMRLAKRSTKKCFSKLDHKKAPVLIMCYSFYGGGAERVACRLAEGLQEWYQPVLLCIQDKEKTYLHASDIPQIVMPTFQGDSENVIEEWAEFTKWMKEQIPFKAAISFMYTMNMLNVKSKNKVPAICSERNNPMKREPEHMEEIKQFYESADHVVFQTKTVQNMFSEDVRSHSSIIPNPVEVENRWIGNSHRIITIGRLNKQKNQAMLIRAFAAFHEKHPEYSLSLYGDGELLEELQQLAQSLEIDRAVCFHGNVQGVHTEIEDAEMFVLSSDYEGMSNALMECMSMGMPCISTACEGSKDLIESRLNGILTEIGNQTELEKAMELLAEDKELREKLGKAAAETAEQFKPERVISKWQQLIESIQ